jgi:4-alpha-glucanotransferase
VSPEPSSPRALVREALSVLGVERLLLGIHDAAFPGSAEDDLGRGTPHSAGARALLDLAHALGFDGLQLGPQGATSASNPSPYDGALFSRDPMSLALAPLATAERGALLSRRTLEELVSRRPGAEERVAHAFAFEAATRAAREIAATFRRKRAAGHPAAVDLGARLARFREENAWWLLPDALHDALEREHRGRHFSRWAEASGEPGALDAALFAPLPGTEREAEARRRALLACHGEAIEDHALVQLLLHEQHASFRGEAARRGLALFGDLQAGMSARDAWAARAVVLPGWLMGAPPSRTNPDGQAWNYPILDPRLYREEDGLGGRRAGPALRFFRARVEKMLGEVDGVRVDHPHGLVCPWVYRAGPDPDREVREGTRLFESPDVAGLEALAVARPDQLDRGVARHADDLVRTLDDAQVERYAILFDTVVEVARAHGRGREDVACEVLSTLPYPLRRVLERHGLGRFRVTQKADLAREDDVYRGENARPEDWIMLGNHDTRPIGIVAEEWVARGAARRQAEYLATRLLAPEEDRERWIARVASRPAELAQARFADLFVGPARNVLVYFTDLLGARAPYNRPGTVSDENWSLRLPRDVAGAYRTALAAERALDLPGALARALRSRGPAFALRHDALLSALERASAR